MVVLRWGPVLSNPGTTIRSDTHHNPAERMTNIFAPSWCFVFTAAEILVVRNTPKQKADVHPSHHTADDRNVHTLTKLVF